MPPCCRLLAVAAAVAVYALVAYIVAFTIELWWLIDSEVSLPLPAYVLCCGYLLIFFSSVSLLHGLSKKQSRFLIAWLFTLTIFSFPEAGLVLFLSLYYWQLKSLNGMTELVFWGCRCVCNVLGLICIHCLLSAWKEEKLLMRRLQSLHMTQTTLSPQQMQDTSNTKNGSGFQNIAYVNSISPPLKTNKLKRSLSTSHLSAGQVPTIPLSMPNSSSEFDASTFNGRMLVARSLVDLSQIGDQETAWSPYATQSLDRRILHRMGSHSNIRAHVLLRSPSHRYRNQSNSSKPSLTESDDLYKYRDIAL